VSDFTAAELLAVVAGFQASLARELAGRDEITLAEESEAAAIWIDAAGAVDLAALHDKVRLFYRAKLAAEQRAAKQRARREAIAQAKEEQRNKGAA